MKDYSWNIKVADLLNNPWLKDKIEFKKKYLKNVKIENPWISWNIFLQWLNHDEILIKLTNINFCVKYICDKCLTEYNQNFFIEMEDNIKFVNPEKFKIEEKIYDDIFFIDMKNQTINIENLIEIIVKNKEPIIKDCWKHKYKKKTDIIKNQENISWYKIDFWKLLKS